MLMSTFIPAIIAHNVDICWIKWHAKYNLPDLKTKISKDIKMSLLYIADYVTRRLPNRRGNI